jgi:class 3 adenylate cyclase
MGETPRKRSIAVLAADAVGYSHAVATDEALALRALAGSRNRSITHRAVELSTMR